MRKYLMLLCMAGMLIFSCSKSGINKSGVNGVPRMDSINIFNLRSPSPYENTYIDPITGDGYAGEAYFTYDNSGRVTKRIAGSRPLPFYDTVIYQSSEDIILIYMTKNPAYNTQPAKREILFKGGYIKWKLYYSVDYYTGVTRTDSVEYMHNAQGQLTMTKGHFAPFNLESSFYYSKAGNLDSVISLYRDNKTGLPQALGWEERFEYDSKANPLKGNCLWDDLFYRSLSNNNFTSYFFRYGGAGWGSWGWSLTYKANGEVDFGK